MKPDAQCFASRRMRFVESMPEDSVAVFFSAPQQTRNSDVHYRYRQDSDFYYLSGFAEEEAALALGPGLQRFYLRPRERNREIWEGRRMGLEEAQSQLGLGETRDINEFWKEFPELLKNRSQLIYAFGLDEKRDGRVFAAARALLQRARGGDSGPGTIATPDLILHEMRLVKEAAEVQLLQEAAAITAAGHLALMQRARPGMYEYELEAILLYEFRRQQAEEGYPSIVASGPNACILHHIRNDRQLQNNELVLVDAGAERNFLTADVTRTWPSSERFTPEQRDVYELTLAAQEAAIVATQVGATIDSVHDCAVRILCRGLLDMGALQGSLDEALEKKSYRSFYMHRTGHWLGSDVHDAGLYHLRGKPRPLAAGMVCTVEPGLYFSPDEPASPPSLRGIGVRIEDDVLVGVGKPLVLTAAIPKDVAEIERIRLTATAALR
ncbi:MAG: aminopeptidase P N-terminal domain-containing protein [Leptospirales bacterium]|nr:aminopeptidase P N-terminal domain-containing protein [Leptospirales bacterium]